MGPGRSPGMSVPERPVAWNVDAYERGRPSYPAAAVDLLVDRLGIGAGSTVLDLGAGTGKLTRQLQPTGARIVAVEPDPGMRARLPEGVEALEGTAEAIPLPDAAVDAVTVGQAFHWFDPDRTLPEIRRVLRPGGGLGVVWNERDESISWVEEYGRIFEWQDRRPYAAGTDWVAVLSPLGDVHHERFRFEQQLDEDEMVARALSTSYVGTWPAARQEEVARRIRDLVAGFPALIRLPYVTDVYWCTTPS